MLLRGLAAEVVGRGGGAYYYYCCCCCYYYYYYYYDDYYDYDYDYDDYDNQCTVILLKGRSHNERVPTVHRFIAALDERIAYDGSQQE